MTSRGRRRGSAAARSRDRVYGEAESTSTTAACSGKSLRVASAAAMSRAVTVRQPRASRPEARRPIRSSEAARTNTRASKAKPVVSVGVQPAAPEGSRRTIPTWVLRKQPPMRLAQRNPRVRKGLTPVVESASFRCLCNGCGDRLERSFDPVRPAGAAFLGWSGGARLCA